MHLRIVFLVACLFLSSCGSHEKKTTSDTLTVTAKSSVQSLFFSGVIQPLKTSVITSPADGVIQEMLFHYGDPISTGKLLFTISSEKFQTDYKTALMQYIKSKNEFDTSQSQLQQSQFLHKNELISDDEFKTKQTTFYNAQLSLVQAKEVLSSMLKQLTVQGFNIDDLTIENIQKISQVLHAQGDIQKLKVNAIVGGVILLPTKLDNGETESKHINKGDQVKQGDVLAVVGDTNGLSIHVSVNEFNINQLKVGQPVKVTCAALPDEILEGKIAGMDRQAQVSSAGMPTFPVDVVVPHLTQKQQDNIHMGMSAKVEIDIESAPEISVPITSVIERDGLTFVKVKDAITGKIQEKSVKTGQTTQDSVVIVSSLKAGDSIVVSH